MFRVKYLLICFCSILFIKFSTERQLPTPLRESEKKSCSIGIHTDLPEPQPLLLMPGTNKTILPDDGIINIKINKSIEFYCTEGIDGENEVNSVLATCIGKDQFSVDSKITQVDKIICEKHSKPITKIVGNCYKNGLLINIGYQLDKYFLNLIELCFDQKQERTHYAYKQLKPAHASYQKNIQRPSWLAGKNYFSNKNVNEVYSKVSQLEQLADLIGGKKKAESIITERIYLVRGHLVPKVDFIYGVEQRATMHFLNAAPQWNAINAGNWFRIEEAVRKLAGEKQLELDVYSGTFGVMDVRRKAFYLTVNSNYEKVMPVPKIFYKIVIDTTSGKGVALITANDPYIDENNSDEYILCKDVSKSISWINGIKDDSSVGLYYACKVNEFTAVVKHLPKNVKATHLLT